MIACTRLINLETRPEAGDKNLLAHCLGGVGYSGVFFVFSRGVHSVFVCMAEQ